MLIFATWNDSQAMRSLIMVRVVAISPRGGGGRLSHPSFDGMDGRATESFMRHCNIATSQPLRFVPALERIRRPRKCLFNLPRSENPLNPATVS